MFYLYIDVLFILKTQFRLLIANHCLSKFWTQELSAITNNTMLQKSRSPIFNTITIFFPWHLLIFLSKVKDVLFIDQHHSTVFCRSIPDGFAFLSVSNLHCLSDLLDPMQKWLPLSYYFVHIQKPASLALFRITNSFEYLSQKRG